jgi:hypothetical protein
MITALRARRRFAGRAAVPVVAAIATLMLASSAAAAPPARSSGFVSASTSGSTGGRSLQTLRGRVRVFASATTAAATNGQLGGSGTGVSVSCWTTGSYYGDNSIWYQISAPMTGYVAAFDLAAHFSPAPRIQHCRTPAFSEVFNSLETNLRIRTGPSTTATIAGYLVSIGSRARIDCYVTGSVILDDAIWYRTVSPVNGYVTGRFLNTGGDPAPGVPRC